MSFDKGIMHLYKYNIEDAPDLYRNRLHKKGLFSIFGNKCLLNIINTLLGQPDNIRIFGNYSMRPKMPNSIKQNVAFHQDAGLRADGSPNNENNKERSVDFNLNNMINCWTSLINSD